MKVLVAEDNPAFAVMLKSLLEGWGYEVVTAREENQACALLQAQDGPRLAILDWTTSGIDGVKLCRRVRSGPAAHYVYILLLTARTQSRNPVRSNVRNRHRSLGYQFRQRLPLVALVQDRPCELRLNGGRSHTRPH